MRRVQPCGADAWAGAGSSFGGTGVPKRRGHNLGSSAVDHVHRGGPAAGPELRLHGRRHGLGDVPVLQDAHLHTDAAHQDDHRKRVAGSALLRRERERCRARVHLSVARHRLPQLLWSTPCRSSRWASAIGPGISSISPWRTSTCTGSPTAPRSADRSSPTRRVQAPRRAPGVRRRPSSRRRSRCGARGRPRE